MTPHFNLDPNFDVFVFHVLTYQFKHKARAKFAKRISEIVATSVKTRSYSDL